MASILYNPYQVAFLEARRKRICRACREMFLLSPDGIAVTQCPLCQSRDIMRAFDRLAIFAGRRGGKTMIGALAALEEMQVPDSVGWACAPTYPKLHDFVMPAIRKLIPEEWFYSGFAKESIEHKEIKIGSALTQFRSLDDPNAGRGPGLNWAWIDEVCETSEDAWDNLRPALTERQGILWVTTSPLGQDWAWRRFHKPALESVPGCWSTVYMTRDNPIIGGTEAGRAELEKARREMSAAKYRREYEASFEEFEGAIYNMESRLILRTDDEVRAYIPEWPRIDPSRESIVGIDPGAKHPFAAVWLVKTEKALVAVGEYLESMRSTRQHAKALLEMTAGHQPRWVIDRTQKQAQIELAQFNISAMQVEAARSSVMASIDRVKAWMEQGQLVYVESRVPRLISQKQSYRFADTNKKSGEKGKEDVYKVDEDLCDAERYAVMSWPTLPSAMVIEKPLGRDLDKDPIPPSMQHTFDRLARLGKRDDGLLPIDLHPVGNMGFVGMSDEEDHGPVTVGSVWG